MEIIYSVVQVPQSNIVKISGWSLGNLRINGNKVKLVIYLLGVPWVHTLTEAILSLSNFLRNFVTKTMMSCGPFNSTNCDIAKTELKADGTLVWNLLVKTATVEGYFSSWFEQFSDVSRCFLYIYTYKFYLLIKPHTRLRHLKTLLHFNIFLAEWWEHVESGVVDYTCNPSQRFPTKSH